ncbi:hypothetical protein DOM21_13315 [Bacteriovorax stolpii]|uniref:Uncharacterized protein n=1 Tax=Bacteriovorax stolpii TaxID=960 RepID=A0A2K9NQ30_BACTC|nr:hypothetical protein [Bacteriovorax stolpii]AUN97621.1 hypothetical protein C0V70_05730 [Bacteriovorax stolpii]QDK42406.1 hypothetical protein DOM21_13315 [Bacteriovorax stolpii]TDP52803.1 hypothetical protein C8D79_2569 [Bacteriovorax stolpii]
MKYLLMVLLTFSLSAHAAEKTKKAAKNAPATSKTMSELGKIDQSTLDLEAKDKNAGIAEETALYAEPGKMKVNFSCKAKDGHEIKQGEKGYDECLQKVKNDKNNPHEPNADIKVHLGN